MTENTKIQMFKTKVYTMINKLNCLNCGKPDNSTKVSTKKLLCSKWCCQEQSSQYVKLCVVCPYCKKKEETTRERVIKSKQGFDEPEQVITPYKWCNWCSKSQ